MSVNNMQIYLDDIIEQRNNQKPLSYNDMSKLFDPNEMLTFLYDLLNSYKKKIIGTQYKIDRLYEMNNKKRKEIDSLIGKICKGGGPDMSNENMFWSEYWYAEYINNIIEYYNELGSLNFYVKNLESWIYKFNRIINPITENDKTRIDFESASNAPIEQVVSFYVNDHFSFSGGQAWACCPLPNHKERTPSFSINDKKNCFYCWGCHSGGGPMQFVMKMEDCGIKEAAMFILKNIL